MQFQVEALLLHHSILKLDKMRERIVTKVDGYEQKPCIPVEELTSENYLSGEPSYLLDHLLSCSSWFCATANIMRSTATMVSKTAKGSIV